MEVQFTPDQKAFARQAVEAGRFSREEEVIGEALALWERRERARLEVFAALESAEESLTRGEGRMITQRSMAELADEVKGRGRARFVAQPALLRADQYCACAT